MSFDKSKDELREEFSRQVNKRKKTGKWCRGKTGVEHESELVVNHNMQTRTCRWFPQYFSFARRAEGSKDWRYSCRHSLRCTKCGKYTEYFLKDPEQLCPDFTPRPA